ncbi:MAG: DUF262 domain-containing protein [Flavobacterium lindanitolerans]|uniref:DUF262 domain-containing protein n=1 Tax=Flavobacterium lindanitolerans TaxID=428988 RepID=UPI001A53F2C4|nr:DUF262 domain-containing protein [Flavobacterium lindanitolerans]MBL7869737.1 DUF262 domain-containing protein [Flavobacterium lindanitolerans]
MNELIQTVESVFTQGDGKVLNIQYKYYYVPMYQRGYKWTKMQIEKLLADINNFEHQPGKFYCVQNITLVPNANKNCYNIVDGQQRLTTMMLILSILGEKALVKDKLIFPDNSIRQYTNDFIQQWVIGENDWEKSWDDFIQKDSNYDHQDIYHLYEGYKTIDRWITKNITDRVFFKNKLLNDVKFICNIIEGEKEEKIFGNLNSKRVYLDGADLVRALLITRVTKEGAKKESIKNIVRINERRVRIGWELDHINQWWNQDAIRNYFKPFVQLKSIGDIHFDLEQYPINQLISLYAASKGWENLSLEEIEQIESSTKFYNEIQELHFEMKDWFQHKEIYHYLGFLFHQSNNKPDFNKVLNYWRTKCETKMDFSKYLLQQIKEILFGNEDIQKVFETRQDWYRNDGLVPVLLFLDIIEALKENRNRLHVDAFLKKDNDIEHIYPQNPRTEKDKKGYLKYLLDFNNNIAADVRIKNREISDLSEEILDELIEEYSENIKTDSIGNLVLLYNSLNRSIQNKSYAYKRKRILDYYNEGNYIQPHTLKVFSRYFQDSNTYYNDSKFWSQIDIDENEMKMKETFEIFFNQAIQS